MIYSRLSSKVIGVLISVAALLSHPVQADFDLQLTKQSPLIQQSQQASPYYTLPLSAMRKVNGVIGAEYDRMLSGTLTRATWQMQPGLSAQNAFKIILGELTDKQAKILYQCFGRKCGSSNQWANQVFQEARLYGIDAKQAYAALEQTMGNNQTHYALYATERGNKKVFLHLDRIQKNLMGQE
jgi:hypothetical protein